MRQRQCGFTLLEMLLAIGLLVLLAGLAYGTLRIGVRGWEASDTHAQSNDELRVAWPFLHQTLEDAQPLADDEGQALFSGTGDSLRWAAELPAHLASGGPLRLRLRIDDAAGGRWPSLRLSYRDLLSPDDDGAEGDRRSATLVEQLARLQIRYFGAPPQGGDLTWQDDWQSRNALPQLVRIDITPANAEPWPSLFAHPRLAGAVQGGLELEQGDPEAADERED
jgi:prepilin-type N-terminal cleavage/methylation domain-containing protein